MKTLSLAVVVRNWVNRLHVFDSETGRFKCGRIPPLDTRYDFASDIDEPGFDVCHQCRPHWKPQKETP